MVKYNFKERETKGEKREEKKHTQAEYMLWFNLKETGDCSGRGECS